MIKKFIYLIVTIALMASCHSGGSQKSGGEFGENDSLSGDSALPVSKEAMENLVQNISSPVEIASLIKSIGVPFSQKYLAPTKIDNFNTANSKAFNLGIMATDLGYLNIYSKTSLVLQYITSIKSLADGISIGQFFDFTTLKRLATNNENIDSLMYISIHSFNVMDDYMRKHKRGNLSTLMVAGGYIEGLYIITQVAKEHPNKDINDYIGGQKTILNELMLILKNYQKDPYFAQLITEMETIKKVLEPVKITIEKGEPKSVERNGMLYIEQNTKSIITITDEQLKSIIAQTEIVRNKLIK
ncbi:MAG: hypothetical protein Q8928_11440 [Bacteroidota bacterium]|nr:hypothetical protein [Bacteroidota bacterium]